MNGMEMGKNSQLLSLGFNAFQTFIQGDEKEAFRFEV